MKKTIWITDQATETTTTAKYNTETRALEGHKPETMTDAHWEDAKAAAEWLTDEGNRKTAAESAGGYLVATHADATAEEATE